MNSIKMSPIRVLLILVVLWQFQASFHCYLFESDSNIANGNWIIKSNENGHKLVGHMDDRLLNDIEIENLPILKEKTDLSYDGYQLSSCQLVPVIHLLKHQNCQPKAISSFACSGSCSSYVQLSTSKFWQHERSCSCCQQTGLQEATFTLDCPSLEPPYRKLKTYAPVDCLCRACTDLGKESLKPQELIEALAGESENAFTKSA